MKKYFNKIIIISLLVLILPLTSGSCLQNLFDLSLKINIAEAATPLNFNNGFIDHSFNNSDDCGPKPTKDTDHTLPKTTRHNSLLPCCFDGSHLNIVNYANTFELENFIPFIVVYIDNAISDKQDKPIYQEPSIAPPELSIIKKTVLRL